MALCANRVVSYMCILVNLRTKPHSLLISPTLVYHAHIILIVELIVFGLAWIDCVIC